MTVYKYFIKAAIRQKWIIIGYLAIFLSISLMDSADTGYKEIGFMESSTNIGIVNNSNSELSKSLIDYLGEQNTIIKMEDDRDYIKEEIFLETVDAVIIIPRDFQIKVENKEESIEIFRDDRKIGPLQIENQINKFLLFSNATYKNGQFDLEKVKTTLNEEVEVEILKTEILANNNSASNWFKNYYNFTAYLITAMYIALIGLIMTEFNNKLIQDRIKISSKKLLRFNIEMYLGQVTLGILITAIFILGSIVLKGKYIGEVDFLKYISNVYVFSFAILCLTFLINNLTTSRFVINGISTVASLGTSFISGVMVSQEFLGEKVLAIAKFFPTYYFVKINEMRVNSFSDMRYEIMMQILFGVAFLTLGLYFAKAKQKT